ncbi:uncharacterized protein [Diadema antillarum]|uniref:uncharacterized protein n=1 Tax=Diadema antillarum TaxID=105358 RepID=UPI003A8568AD
MTRATKEEQVCTYFVLRTGLKTIHRWMKAPNQRSRHAAKDYKGLIDARVAPKQNTAAEERPDTHYLRARVKYALEMCAELEQQAAVISMDNKNKVHIGSKTLAVNRHLQPGRFFPTNDQPNYQDHDFPTPGYLITPSGYFVMKPGEKELFKDEKGREHFRFDRIGETHVVNRPPGVGVNIESHLCDVLPITQELREEGRTAVLLVVDNGADFNPRSHVTQFFYGKLWKDGDLDAMAVLSYCAGDSKLNPIERIWGHLTKKLTAVYLRDVLPDEDLPPRQQRLEQRVLEEKEKKVFKLALEQLDGYWDGMAYAGCKVSSRHVISEPQAALLPAVQHSLSSKRALILNNSMHEETKFQNQHLRRLDGMLIFTKCVQEPCRHCTEHPPVSKAACQLFSTFPTPVPSSQDTYETYITARAQARSHQDEHMPSRITNHLGTCERCSTLYIFTSKTDKIRHMRLMH